MHTVEYKLLLNAWIGLICLYVSHLLALLEFGLSWYLPTFVFHLGVLAVVAAMAWPFYGMVRYDYGRSQRGRARLQNETESADGLPLGAENAKHGPP